MGKPERKEARVFVRHGSPWIGCVCPCCNHDVSIKDNNCSNCGTPLGFLNYHKVQETGGHGLNLSPKWTEVFIDDEINKTYFITQLKKLERQCRVEDGSILKVMRDAYIKTCFEK